MFNPKSCSIATLPAEEILNIINQLLDAQLPNNTQMERDNLKGFQNVIKQFQYWEKEARKRDALLQETGKSNTIEGYLSSLNTFISKETDLSYEEQLATSMDIETKLRYILDVAETHGRLDDATKHILDLDYKTLIQSLPKMDREHTLYLFKTFIMPLPD